MADKDRGLITQLVDISSKTAMQKFSGPAVTLSQSGCADQECDRHHLQVGQAGLHRHSRLRRRHPAYRFEQPGVRRRRRDRPERPALRERRAFQQPRDQDLRGGDARGRPHRRHRRRDGAGLSNPAAEKSGQVQDRQARRLLPYFGLSAEPWQKSTSQSVNNIFGTATIKVCPPEGTPATKLLSPLAHFINCHGGSVDPQFYGQHGDNFPVS